jgi:hypothetical protein
MSLSRTDPVPGFVRSRQRFVRGSQTGGACYAPLAANPVWLPRLADWPREPLAYPSGLGARLSGMSHCRPWRRLSSLLAASSGWLPDWLLRAPGCRYSGYCVDCYRNQPRPDYRFISLQEKHFGPPRSNSASLMKLRAPTLGISSMKPEEPLGKLNLS